MRFFLKMKLVLKMKKFNMEVDLFLDNLNHPRRKEIDALRNIILNSLDGIIENIKWNAPNYIYDNEDRITMRIMPTKYCQLIFHCGAKVITQPKEKLIVDPAKLLIWKDNSRAVADFKSIEDILSNENVITQLILNWLLAKY